MKVGHHLLAYSLEEYVLYTGFDHTQRIQTLLYYYSTDDWGRKDFCAYKVAFRSVFYITTKRAAQWVFKILSRNTTNVDCTQAWSTKITGQHALPIQ